MIDKTIIKENENVKAKIEFSSCDITLLTCRNGWQWTGQPMTPGLAKLTIEVLQEYLKVGPSKQDDINRLAYLDRLEAETKVHAPRCNSMARRFHLKEADKLREKLNR